MRKLLALALAASCSIIGTPIRAQPKAGARLDAIVSLAEARITSGQQSARVIVLLLSVQGGGFDFRLRRTGGVFFDFRLRRG